MWVYGEEYEITHLKCLAQGLELARTERGSSLINGDSVDIGALSPPHRYSHCPLSWSPSTSPCLSFTPGKAQFIQFFSGGSSREKWSLPSHSMSQHSF